MLQLTLKDGEKTVDLKWDGQSRETEEDVITGILKNFDIDVSTILDKSAEKKVEKAAEGYKTFKTEIKGLHNPKSEFEKPNYNPKERGVRVYLGKKHYQTFYICTDCGNKGKHFISEGTPTVHCHEPSCSKEMQVRLADFRGLPHQDAYGNYFIAGDFNRTMKVKEEEENEDKDERKIS